MTSLDFEGFIGTSQVQKNSGITNQWLCTHAQSDNKEVVPVILARKNKINHEGDFPLTLLVLLTTNNLVL